MKKLDFLKSRESKVRFGFFVFLIILSVVWVKRKKISEMKVTQQKMEIFKALFDQDIDSAKLLLEEMVDSSFYIK